jgi:hypothetical protein
LVIDATKEAIHLRQSIWETFTATVTGPTTIWEDNPSYIAYYQNILVSEKTKPIGMKYHFVKDHEQLRSVNMRYLPT